MRAHPFSFILTVLVFISFQAASRASYRFTNTQYEAFTQTLESTLEHKVEDLHLEFLQSINERFAVLPRREAAVEDMREVKFFLQYWRMRTAEKIFEALKNDGETAPLKLRIEQLDLLRLTLSPEQISALVDHPLATKDLTARATLISFLATQGQGEVLDSFLSKTNLDKSTSALLIAHAGPRADVPINPLVPSEYPFERWAENAEFSNYAYPDPASRNTILYRGLTLKAGDFILMNANDLTDADFSSLGKERTYISHFGIIAFMEKNGRRFPVGIEMHTNGLRAIPLSRFISREFAAYVEIYRLRGKDEAWREKINSIAMEEVKKPRGYDFHSQDADRRYLNCATSGSLFLELSGEKPIEAETIVREGIRDDFAMLGLHYERLLTPTDKARNPRVEYIGMIDQGLYAELLAKDLTAGRLVKIFNEGTIDFSRAPLDYHIFKWSVGHIKRESRVGKLILKWKKMDRKNFPNAPAKLLGWLIPFENRYRKMVERSLPLLVPRILELGPSLHEIQEDPEIQRILDDHEGKLKNLFSNVDSSSY